MWLYYMTSYGALVSLSVDDLLKLAECFTNTSDPLNSILSLQAEWLNRMNINENLLDVATQLRKVRLQQQQQQQQKQQDEGSDENLNHWNENYF